LENIIIDGRTILKFFLLKHDIRIYAGYVWEQGPVVDFVSVEKEISIYQKDKTSREIIRKACYEEYSATYLVKSELKFVPALN
jgi:hypothetical protein